MTTTTTKTAPQTLTLKALKFLPLLPAGRLYFALAPMAWGKAETAAAAVRNCRRNYSESLAGPFKFILYDAPADIAVDGMGNATTTSDEPAREVGRYRVKPTDLQGR